MSKKKSNNSINKLLEKFNNIETNGNAEQSLLKTLVDAAAGSVVGTSIGAMAGDKAPLAGLAMIMAGHYLGDKSGLLRITGIGAMVYGIGKAKEYKNNPKLNTVQNRLKEAREDILSAFHLDWKQKEAETKVKTESNEEGIESSKTNSEKP